MGEFGSPNFTGAANICMVPRMTAFNSVTGGIRAEPDYDNTNLVLFWGSNPLESERFGSYSAYDGMRKIIPRLKQRGARIICIDPFRTLTVQQADEWLRPNPGSDIALGLAMISVIIAEDLHDKEFVETYTLGFDQLKEHVKGYSPEWAEALTGIPAQTIRDVARDYATTKPAAIYEGNGLDMYTSGVDAVRAIAMLICLTGNLDAPGGNVFMPFARQSVLPTRPVPKGSRVWYKKFPLFPEVPFPAIKEAILREEDHRPRAMIVHHSNPVLVQANERRTRKALDKLEFMVVADIFPTATSELADLVLPITSDFETFGYRAYSSVEGGFVALARPVVEPVGETKSVFEVEYELARRMGIHLDYPFQDTVGWIDFMLKPSGITFERLDSEQIVYATPPVKYRKYKHQGFKTPSGKVELYSQMFEANGATPMPTYTGSACKPSSTCVGSEKEFPLTGTSRRPTQFVHTKFKNLETLSSSYPEPLFYIHPKDARRRGIGDGDEVVAASPQGEVTLRAKLTEDTKSGLVWIDFGWGNPTDGKANINILTNDEDFDPVSGGTPNRIFPCKVRRS
jgi:anaerobic selenocysteine-containing dehydrogenase